jgi:hypothetical protein
VSHRPVPSPDERTTPRSEQGQEVLREANRGPFPTGWKALFHPSPKKGIDVNANPFAALVGKSAFRWPANARRLDVAVIGGQPHTKAPVNKDVKKSGHESLFRPQHNLAVHAAGAQLHTVHYLIDFINDQTQNPSGMARRQFLNSGKAIVFARFSGRVPPERNRY